MARKTWVLVALFLVCLLPVTLSISVKAETAYVYGCKDWAVSGQYWQFRGDANTSIPSGYEACPDWDENCVIDKGFYFREVVNVNTSTCSYDVADPDTCYLVVAVCCYWVGEHSTLSEVCEGAFDCVQYDQECGNNDYCGTIWEVKGFNTGPGDADYGCWELEYVCDPSEDCHNSLSECDAVRNWSLDCAVP